MKIFRLFGIAALGLIWTASVLAQAEYGSARGLTRYDRLASQSALRRLSPVQVYRVPPVSVSPARELPDPAPGGPPVAAVAGVVVLPPVPVPPLHRSAQGATVIAATVPVVNLSALNPSLATFFDERSPGLLPPWRISGRRAGPAWSPFFHAGVFNERTNWLSGLPSQGGWSMGSENWRYNGPAGLGLTLGNDWTDAPAWSKPARMGGVRIAGSSAADQGQPGPWAFSLMAGVLDYSPASASEGDLVYGPAATTSVLEYTVNPELTLESQVQWAPDLLTTGVGAEYKTHGWGAWTVGVAKATQNLYQGWRYQAGYRIDLMDVGLSWVTERRTGGFSDLARYKDFSADRGQSRNEWKATVPLGQWGDLTGGYERIREGSGQSQRFGLTQQFWYSSNLRVGLRAEREVQSGAYDVGVHFSIPVY